MKISASIYSDARQNLQQTILALDEHQVDLLHIDCNDDLAVFDDILQIRTWCSLPIDLHIITPTPSKFYQKLLDVPVEYVTFQLEPLAEPLIWPAGLSAAKGVAVTTPTSIDAFDAHTDCDFILIMATIPGQSGGVFDKENFKKIRTFRKRYPHKSIHVDGGVNGEVSFILRNMGVSTSVSGSYLFKGPSIGHALLNLTSRNMASAFQISDFMIPLEECPVVMDETTHLKEILETIENGKLGFCLVGNEDRQLKGLISSADIRKALLKKIDNPKDIALTDMINTHPVTIEGKQTVLEMLKKMKTLTFPIMYLPVVDSTGKMEGIINFVNLIKGEI
jgi:pentose-5-phosphate-3-epimerase